jgi:gamma-glutamyltranspeptidase/glutathione hydrolase
VIVNVVDHKMTLRDAVAAPRFHHQWLPDELRSEKGHLTADTSTRLHERGHTLRVAEEPQGAVAAIRVDPVTGTLEGVWDPRAPDGAAIAQPRR